MVRIAEVKKANVGTTRSRPPKTIVYAAGTVPTSGWSNPQLAPWYYIMPPEDGIQDIDFYATPPKPGSIVLQTLRDIDTDILMDRDPFNYWGPGKKLNGVRIHSASNALEAFFDPGSPRSEFVPQSPDDAIGAPSVRPLSPDFVPWPMGDNPVVWPFATPFDPLGAPIRSLLGRPVRCYVQGSPTTDDYVEDRVNIETDDSHRIIAIRFG